MSTGATGQTGAGILIRCLSASTTSRITYGARSITKGSCLSFCHKTAASQGYPQVSEARDEALWSAGYDRHGQASVVPADDPGDRQCG